MKTIKHYNNDHKDFDEYKDDDDEHNDTVSDEEYTDPLMILAEQMLLSVGLGCHGNVAQRAAVLASVGQRLYDAVDRIEERLLTVVVVGRVTDSLVQRAFRRRRQPRNGSSCPARLSTSSSASTQRFSSKFNIRVTIISCCFSM